MSAYLVLVREKDGWSVKEETSSLAEARKLANDDYGALGGDRCCVMEVGGRDALPTFTLKYTVMPGPSGID